MLGVSMSFDGVFYIFFGEISIYLGSWVEMMLYILYGSLYIGVFDVLILKVECIYFLLMFVVNCLIVCWEML